MNAQHFLKDCQVDIWPEHYAIVRAKCVPNTFLAVFNDQEETTVVASEKFLADNWVIEAERGWKLLSFRTVLPFALTGFLAVIANALAENKIAIFVLSAYSTDHLLVKEDDLAATECVLADLGCKVAET